MTGRVWLLLVALVVGCDQETTSTSGPNAPAETTTESTLTRAAAFLWSQQANDGGWHSETYGLLKSGQSLTPFLLHTLLAVPEVACSRPEGGVKRALEFIRQHIDERGAIGLADPDVLDYPNYSTAYALLCFLAVDDSQDRELIGRMRDYLIAEQYCEARGFSPDAPAYGGWGFGGTHPPGQPGHMDLAHTRRVLEALLVAGAPTEVFGRAESFLQLVQKHEDDERPQPLPPEHAGQEEWEAPFDGGFYFSPVVLSANKGRLVLEANPPYWRSYATATCDGLLALLAAGVERDDPRVTAAAAWLDGHKGLDHPEGIPAAYNGERWGDAVHFYHLAVRAEAFTAFDQPGDWTAQIRATLAPHQQSNGSFVNKASELMKENDPLLCTALAVVALGGAEVHQE